MVAGRAVQLLLQVDGVVVIPRADLETILARLDEVRRMEEETQAKIRAGITHLASIEELLKSDKVAYLD